MPKIESSISGSSVQAAPCRRRSSWPRRTWSTPRKRPTTCSTHKSSRHRRCRRLSRPNRLLKMPGTRNCCKPGRRKRLQPPKKQLKTPMQRCAGRNRRPARAISTKQKPRSRWRKTASIKPKRNTNHTRTNRRITWFEPGCSASWQKSVRPGWSRKQSTGSIHDRVKPALLGVAAP